MLLGYSWKQAEGNCKGNVCWVAEQMALSVQTTHSVISRQNQPRTGWECRQVSVIVYHGSLFNSHLAAVVQRWWVQIIFPLLRFIWIVTMGLFNWIACQVAWRLLPIAKCTSPIKVALLHLLSFWYGLLTQPDFLFLLTQRNKDAKDSKFYQRHFEDRQRKFSGGLQFFTCLG